LSQLVEQARTVTGREIPLDHVPAKDEPQRLVADATRIGNDLGWQAARSQPDVIVSDAWTALQSPANATPASRTADSGSR
jgi:UDP-glucose 4-epimerase